MGSLRWRDELKIKNEELKIDPVVLFWVHQLSGANFIIVH
jgi:hypothetical protein